MQSMSATDVRNGIIAGFVMLAIGGVFVLTGVMMGAHRKKVAATYPTTQALVTKLRASTNYTGDGTAADSVTTFKVDLEYTVDGTTYKCTKKSRGRMEGLVTIYYHPSNPNKVYTEAQALSQHVASWYIIAGIVGGLGLCVIVYVLTQIGKRV